MATVRDIVAEIAATMPPQKHGAQPWHLREAAQHGELFAAIHGGWHDGAFGSQQMQAARAIAAKLKECGINIGPQGVLHWLRLPRS